MLVVARHFAWVARGLVPCTDAAEWAGHDACWGAWGAWGWRIASRAASVLAQVWRAACCGVHVAVACALLCAVACRAPGASLSCRAPGASLSSSRLPLACPRLPSLASASSLPCAHLAPPQTSPSHGAHSAPALPAGRRRVGGGLRTEPAGKQMGNLGGGCRLVGSFFMVGRGAGAAAGWRAGGTRGRRIAARPPGQPCPLGRFNLLPPGRRLGLAPVDRRPTAQGGPTQGRHVGPPRAPPACCVCVCCMHHCVRACMRACVRACVARVRC